MKVEKRDGSLERKVLTAMIVDKTVLSRIAQDWKPDLFQSDWSNLIASWCVSHYERYHDAPMHLIEDIFTRWAESSNRNKALVSSVESYLQGMSGEYKSQKRKVRSEYILERATELFDTVALRRLSEQLEKDLSIGNLESARTRFSSFKFQDSVSADTGISVLSNEAAIEQAFTSKSKPLIRYKGALGKFLGSMLERDGFVSFLAGEKVGKTWWEMEIGWQAMRQGKRVAFFEVGDMSQNQIMRRFLIRAMSHPMEPKMVQVPEMLLGTGDGKMPEVEYRKIHYKSAPTLEFALDACRKIREQLEDENLLRLAVYPNNTLNVAGIKAVIDRWEKSDWIPDVVIIDYADILAPPSRGMDHRDGINETWKQLRALSQQLHGLVLTATQADASSYGQVLLSKKNFSEDKRKLSHVTGMIGINATDVEKERGIYRLNTIVSREQLFTETQYVYVAGCLDIGRPFIKSCW